MDYRKQLLYGEWDFFFAPTTLANINLAEVVFDKSCHVPNCFDATGEYRFKRGCGIYRKEICASGKIKLEIEGIGLRASVFWDRQKISEMNIPFTAEQFVFDAGKYGKHELIIATENTLDSSPSSMFHPFYDFYGYGGIYRDVYITPLPEVWVEFARVTTLDLKSGKVEILLQLGGNWQKGVDIELGFDNGKTFIVSGKSPELTFCKCVPDKREWTPDSPVLHSMQINLNGNLQEVTFGLRIIEINEGRICLNGKAIKLVGFNRHDAHPDYGYAIHEKLIRADLEKIKKAGYNFIRGCHYPQSETMLKICDELGLLVWDESLGWGNKITSLTDPVFCDLQQRQTRKMVRRSINHPSIILWGFLNEAETNVTEARNLIEKIYRTVKSEDSSRLVTFATMFGEEDLCLDLVDVISFNTYPGWYGNVDMQEFSPQAVLEKLRQLADYSSQEKWRNKGLILSEIGAAALPGDHSGLRWSEEYQANLLSTVLNEVWENERWSGVAFWLFADTKTYSDGRALARPRGFNNKGVLNEYRLPKLAWEVLIQQLKEKVQFRRI